MFDLVKIQKTAMSYASFFLSDKIFSSELFYFTFQTAKKHLHTVKI